MMLAYAGLERRSKEDLPATAVVVGETDVTDIEEVSCRARIAALLKGAIKAAKARHLNNIL